MIMDWSHDRVRKYFTVIRTGKMASGIVPPPTHSFPTYSRNVFGTKAGMKTTAQLIGFDFQLRTVRIEMKMHEIRRKIRKIL